MKKDPLFDVMIAELLHIAAGKGGDTALGATRVLERILQKSILTEGELSRANGALRAAYIRTDTQFEPHRVLLHDFGAEISDETKAAMAAIDDNSRRAAAQSAKIRVRDSSAVKPNRFWDMFNKAGQEPTL